VSACASSPRRAPTTNPWSGKEMCSDGGAQQRALGSRLRRAAGSARQAEAGSGGSNKKDPWVIRVATPL
jgi:hypothetical protein